MIGGVLECPGKGGNISVKDNTIILVKASGADLKHPHKAVLMKDNKFVSAIKIKKNSINISDSYLKPTMEIGFHQLIKSRYVVHYHPIYVLPYLCLNNPHQYLSNYTVIDYASPGDCLTEEIKTKYHESVNEEGVIMLKQHGVIIYSNDMFYIEEAFKKIKKEFFITNSKIFTPDDLIDKDSAELYLFREYISGFAESHKLRVNELSSTDLDHLINDEDEKYRQTLMKGKK